MIVQHRKDSAAASSAPLRLPKSVLFDLDGTLYRGDEPVPGADRLIAFLNERDISCWYVTNNSSRIPAQVAKQLAGMGIPATDHQVITSSLAAADYAASHYPGGSAYVIGETGLRDALNAAGIRLLPDEDEESPADLVVQGMDRNFSYGQLAAAVRHMLKGAVYLLTNPDLLVPTRGKLIPGAGSLGAALTAASGQQPVVIGKPSAILMDYALKRAAVPPEEAWVVGDNPFTDIAAAVNAGCPSILTLTGLCTADDWQDKCRSAGVRPDAVCAGLDELQDMMLKLLPDT